MPFPGELLPEFSLNANYTLKMRDHGRIGRLDWTCPTGLIFENSRLETQRHKLSSNGIL